MIILSSKRPNKQRKSWNGAIVSSDISRLLENLFSGGHTRCGGLRHMNSAKFVSSAVDGSAPADRQIPTTSVSQFKILTRVMLLFLLAGPWLAVFAQTNE